MCSDDVLLAGLPHVEPSFPLNHSSCTSIIVISVFVTFLSHFDEERRDAMDQVQTSLSVH